MYYSDSTKIESSRHNMGLGHLRDEAGAKGASKIETEIQVETCRNRLN
jgi:hypothetical protein